MVFGKLKKNKKRMACMALLGILLAFGVAEARHHHWYSYYSDGHLTYYVFRDCAPYIDHLHFGLVTGLGRYIADGNWYGDPTVWPDTVSPSAPGVREHTKDLAGVLENIKATTSSIDKTLKETDDIYKKIYQQGENKLAGVSGSVKDDMESGDAIHKDQADLKVFSTWVNPEKREEYNKLDTPIDYYERKRLVSEMPILDVKGSEDIDTADKRMEVSLTTQKYHQKVLGEGTAARELVLAELQRVEEQVARLQGTEHGNMLSEGQKNVMLKALKAKMQVLDMKLKHINDTEKEVNRKYELKKNLEDSAHASAAVRYPGYDPYNPTEEDKKKVSSSSNNFGFLSFLR